MIINIGYERVPEQSFLWRHSQIRINY